MVGPLQLSVELYYFQIYSLLFTARRPRNKQKLPDGGGPWGCTTTRSVGNRPSYQPGEMLKVTWTPRGPKNREQTLKPRSPGLGTGTVLFWKPETRLSFLACHFCPYRCVRGSGTGFRIVPHMPVVSGMPKQPGGRKH